VTRDELLAIMQRHGACEEATWYVRGHSSDDAAEIGTSCERVNWLIWLLARERRLDRFVAVCARRAAKHAPGSSHARSAAEAADNTTAYAAAYAAYAAYAAADAAYAAYAAADGYKAEHAAQLKGLHRIWRDWCAGAPAETALPLPGKERG